MFCLADCYVIGVIQSLVLVNCHVIVCHLCLLDCNIIGVFESSALVNYCIVIQVSMSLMFDCFMLVDCCVVVHFEARIELSVQQSVVFVFFTDTYKS